MMKRFITAAVLATISAGAALALEAIELNNTYPVSEQVYELSDRWFFKQDNQGYFEVVKGPFESGPARCIGSGFFFPDGRRRISGNCIFGEGEDTFTMRWETGDRDAANFWEIAARTGKYEGMTGDGISTTATVRDFKALPLRQTHISGYLDIPGQ